ncbi:MAG: tRNA (adenosine(37)-N6)-dimethylallyltransferase MiaA [Lentisphaeria bacterium]|nr:tRNA (adenosine(37)-N6)-dimethylallyltransferase MiaA [Lentisphaeria bacterium]
MPPSRHIIAILGPTASGKSAVALELARRLPSDILSCDSMQVYKELAIGTAKPSRAELDEVKHHLISEKSIHERFDTNQFVLAARSACELIWKQEKTVILAGGTGLYAKSLLYDFNLRPADQTLFKTICSEAESAAGLACLRAELKAAGYDDEKSPDVFSNPRRLIRAIEIARLTKHRQGEGNDLPPLNAVVKQFILMPPNDLLRQRIFARTARMLADGWIEETVQLTQRGLFNTPTAYQALGYREIHQWLEEGNHDLKALEMVIATKTWQYARRQLTWFKRQHPGACLLPLKHDYSVSGIVQAINAVCK